MKTTTEMQLVPIAKLVPYVNNARTHSPEQINKLRSSLREFGFINPVIIDRDFGVIAGHGRILAAKEEGITEVPCVFADHLTEAQKKAYIIADNRMAMDAGWDEELLRVEIEALQGMDFDPMLTGFDEKELADLFGTESDSEAKDDDFDLTAALEKAAFVERGDIWTVGRHRLMCGDATDAGDVALLMGGRKANLIVTDPPYGVSFKSSSGLTIQNDSMKNEEFYNFLFAAFKCMADVLEKGGAAYVFHADTEGLNFRKAFIDAGFHLAGVCIWVKNSLVLGRSDYQWQHEPVLYGFLQNGKHPWYSDRKQTTIWNYDKPKRNANHPTSKPLDLLGYPIGNSSQENSIVIDTFGGSGSTMMACEQMNRMCFTMELDEKYASVILRRAVENGIDPADIYVERNGEKMMYSDLVKEVEVPNEYGAITRDIYGYRISVVDLREPTRSDGNNLLTLINRYMDEHRENPGEIPAKAKAEKYAKILAKTIISPEGEGGDHGQNAYFYDAAEGLLASVVLLLSEFLPPEETDGYETRHIASVFKLVQELLMQGQRGGNQFQELMQLLPSEHKAKWLAGSALTASEPAMNSIMSTVLSKLNAFLDTELEQVLCFDGGIDAELFVREKCAIFLILPEEDATKNFVASLMIQNLARELFSVANEHGGKLPNRAVFFCDELGTMPPFDILPLFSAGRSRRLTLVPIIQSLAQLEKNYGKEGAEILADNCQDTIFGGFAPNSQTAAALSENLGSRTVLSGSVTQGKDNNSQSLQMMERPLMSPDELKSMPKGSFVVMKTGTHPMKTKLKLFFEWGIRFEKPLQMEDRGSRPVHYAGKTELERAILSEYPLVYSEEIPPMQTNLKATPIPESTTLKT